MKILEALDKEVKGKKYYRYRINLPKNIVEESKLKGKKLKATSDKEKIIIPHKLPGIPGHHKYPPCNNNCKPLGQSVE